ncbi:MAG: Gfo/Idh/MocA family protein [Christensenellales bacterium]
MSRKVRTAVIGCGKVGHFHANAFQRCETSEFVAAYARKQETAQAFAGMYGVEPYTSITRMVKEMDVEAVAVCTPHPIHAQNAVEAAQAGAHLLIEKPLAVTLADCDAILAAAEAANVRVSTVCQRRFYPASMRVKKAIEDGKIGGPIIGSVTMLGWRDMNYYNSDPWRGTWEGEGGGVLVNQAPHQFDLLLWYMGEIDTLYGLWDTLNHPALEVEDTAAAVIRFKSGALGSILVSNSVNPALYGKVHVHGENGASVGVQTDGGSMFIAGVSSITEPPVNDLWTVAGEGGMLEQWKKEDTDVFNKTDMYHFHCLQASDFLDAIIHGREPLVTGVDGRRTVELFTAIYRSNAENKPVKFPLGSE